MTGLLDLLDLEERLSPMPAFRQYVSAEKTPP